jgi:DNA-binding response OmpR family regulator
MKVFIVDDDQDVAESMADLVALRGHEADIANSGEAAIDRFRDHDYDIAFMDVRMPGINGVESFLEIRKFKPTARVVIMTGYSVENLLVQALDNGALTVLYKPFQSGEFLALL